MYVLSIFSLDPHNNSVGTEWLRNLLKITQWQSLYSTLIGHHKWPVNTYAVLSPIAKWLSSLSSSFILSIVCFLM